MHIGRRQLLAALGGAAGGNYAGNGWANNPQIEAEIAVRPKKSGRGDLTSYYGAARRNLLVGSEKSTPGRSPGLFNSVS